MRDFSLLFSVYTPVYIYAILVLYFAAYMAISSPKGSPNTLASFLASNRTWFHNLTFFVIILSMLGTPPTVGFFGKLLTFYLLSQNPGAPLLAALLFNLLLMIFYLQTTRSKAYAKRRNTFKVSSFGLSYAIALLYGQFFMIGFAFFLPAVVDVLAALFM